MSNPTGLNTSDINYITFRSISSGQEFKFSAFLTNFSDDYKSNWNSQEIFGRMDPVYTYKNTVRKIAIGFDVPSYDIDESKRNTIKAEKLIRGLYPVYKELPNGRGTAIITTPPYFKIKFANLIDELGWIDGFSFKPELESGFFFDKDKVLAKLFKVSFTFNVVHSKALGFKVDEEGNKTVRAHENAKSTFPYGMQTIPAK